MVSISRPRDAVSASVIRGFASSIISGFAGVTHSITFDEKGEGGTGDIFMHQVKGGKITLLGNAADLAK